MSHSFSLSAIAPVAGPRHDERCRRKKKKRVDGREEVVRAMQDQERKRYPVGTCTRLKRFTASAAARPGKSGTGCRDTDLTNHKGRTYTRITATHSSIQGRAAEQRRKLVRFVMLINWLTFPSYYYMNRKLLSRETLEKWVREYARGAIATGRRFHWMDKVNEIWRNVPTLSWVASAIRFRI